VEIFRIRTEEEARKKLLRRRKRAKEKKDNIGQADDDDDDMNDALKRDTQLVDLFTPHLIVRSSGKIRSFDFPVPDSNKTTFPVSKVAVSCFLIFTDLQIFLALATNALEVFNIPPPSKSKGDLPEATKTYSLDLPGHRTDVRSLSLTSDDNLLASASNGTCCRSCGRATIQCVLQVRSRFGTSKRHHVSEPWIADTLSAAGSCLGIDM
jgi:U3 small nucleolar RNA-associated protein 12